MRVLASPGFAKAARKLLTEAERAEALQAIASAPDAWPVIQGTGGARKARVARGGRGKSGGARVIYFHMPAPGVLALLMIYAKAEKEDLTHGDKQAVRAAIAAIRESLGDDGAR